MRLTDDQEVDSGVREVFPITWLKVNVSGLRKPVEAFLLRLQTQMAISHCHQIAGCSPDLRKVREKQEAVNKVASTKISQQADAHSTQMYPKAGEKTIIWFGRDARPQIRRIEEESGT